MRKWQPALVSWDSRKSHGQRSPAGYNPWGPKESDKSECACMRTYTHTPTHTSLEEAVRARTQTAELCGSMEPLHV